MEFIKRCILALIMPFNYLFYKLYIFTSHLTFSGTPMSHLAVMSVLISMNIMTVYLGIYGSFPPNKVFLILILLLPYAFPKVADKIVSKYENESEDSNIIGNIVVVAYIVISIISLILVS